jgi:hypothetical protein
MVYPDIPAHAAANATGGASPPGFGPSAACTMDSDCMGTAPCSGGFCTDIPDQPQTALDYEWSKVRVVIDTVNGNIGGQVYADLTITQDSCTQQFHVTIISPRASCTGQDNMGNPVGDPSLCAANANSDPDNYPIVGDASMMAKIYGSGLFASVPVKCQNIYPPAATGGDGGASAPTPDFECMPTKTAP